MPKVPTKEKKKSEAKNSKAVAKVGKGEIIPGWSREMVKYSSYHLKNAYESEQVKKEVVQFNLSETDIVPGTNTSIVVTQVDGTTHSITETVGKCSVAGVPSLNSVVLENDMNITVTSNGIVLTNYTVTGIDPDLIALGNTVKVDVVLFNDNTVTAVPMAGYDDLIAIAANQP